MVHVGFSTESLKGSELSFDDRIKFISNSTANAIELSFPTLNDLIKSFPTLPKLVNKPLRKDAVIESIKKYDFVSIHAPWQNVTYFEEEDYIDTAISRLGNLYKVLTKNGINLGGF